MAGGAEGAALVPTLPPNLEHRCLVVSAAHRADAMRRALYALGLDGMALGFMNWQQRLKDVAAKLEAKKITVSLVLQPCAVLFGCWMRHDPLLLYGGQMRMCYEQRWICLWAQAGPSPRAVWHGALDSPFMGRPW